MRHKLKSKHSSSPAVLITLGWGSYRKVKINIEVFFHPVLIRHQNEGLVL